MSNKPRNAYVGPRPLGPEDSLYGRDRELDNLLDLLIAERIVMLHSPSGAGKSSLLYSGLVPDLSPMEDEPDDEGAFDVLPVLRVSSVSGEAATEAGANRFVLSLLASLEEQREASERRSLADLADVSFEEYLEQRRSDLGAGLPELLVFDQFEEILTLDSTGFEAKTAFFKQLGLALKARHRSAIFAIREDYLPALEQYRALVPTGMKNTFRLDLLGAEGALQAVQGPAEEAGIPFEPDAARQLVDDLRRTTIMDGAGKATESLGPHVEPVQLQVVCHELWRDLPPGTTTIGQPLLKDVGDVDQALAGFYAAQVERAATRAGIKERPVREWVEARLISRAGIRTQVLRTSEAEQGLAHEALDSLVDAHLVRAESRRGATWYELTHDRLVGPVKADNDTWRQRHLVPLQLQAQVWEQKGRPRDLLLRGEALVEAEDWALDHADELTDQDRSYLRESGLLRDQQERERERAEAEQRQRELEQSRILAESRRVAARRLAVGLVSTLVLLVLVAIASVLAWMAKQEADRMRAIAETRRIEVETERRRTARQLERLVAFSAASMEDQPLVGALLLTELKDRGEPQDGVAIALTLGQRAIPSALLRGHGARLTAVDLSPDGKQVVTASADGTARIWSADGKGAPRVLKGHGGWVLGARFGPRGQRVITASADGTARIWSAVSGKLIAVLKGHKGRVMSASFSANGKYMVTASADRTARIWNAANRKPVAVLEGHKDRVTAASFCASGEFVVTASADGIARIWSAPGGKLVATLKGHGAALQAAAFSADGKRVVTASADGTARVWDVASGGQLLSLQGHTAPVTAASFCADGKRVLTASTDGTARVWRADGTGKTVVLRGHQKGVLSARFSADGGRVVTASADGTARVWWAAGGAAFATLRGHADKVVSARFSADGKRVVTASADRTAALWPGQRLARNIMTLGGHRGEVTSADVTSGGRMVTGSADGAVQYWVVSRGAVRQRVVLGRHRGRIRSARFSADGLRVVVATAGAAYVHWVDRRSPPVRLAASRGRITDAAMDGTGRWVVTATDGGAARIWRADGAGGGGFLPRPHAAGVTGVDFSKDGKLVATGSRDGTARVCWLDASGKATRTRVLKGHTDRVISVRFDSNGRRVITASLDRTARVWDLSRAGAPVVLQGHTDEVTDARFSADGRFVVTASYDRTARVWLADGKGIPVVLGPHKSWVRTAAFDRSGGRVVTATADEVWVQRADGQGKPLVLRGHNDKVYRAMLTPEGDRVVSASADRTVKVWDISSSWKTLVTQLAARTSVCLTESERARYLAELPREARKRFILCERRNARAPAQQGAGAGEVKIALAVSPANAVATLNGEPIKSNPLVLVSKGLPRVLEVSAAGYATQTVQVSDSISQTIHVTLKRGRSTRRAGKRARSGRTGPATTALPTLAKGLATAPPPPPPVKEDPAPAPAPKAPPVKAPAPVEPDAGPVPDTRPPAPDQAAPAVKPAPKPPKKKPPKKKKKKGRKSLYFDDDL